MYKFYVTVLITIFSVIGLGACSNSGEDPAPVPEKVVVAEPEVKTPEVKIETSSPEVTPVKEAEKPEVIEKPKPVAKPKPEAKPKAIAKPAEKPVEKAAKVVKTGSICGKVTKASGATPMANVLVVAREYSNWVIHARDKTSADGSYCLNVPAGRYNIGAINSAGQEIDPEKSASEWWSKTGNARGIRDGDIVRFAKTPVAGINFDLSPGARIQGKLVTFDKGSAEGVEIFVREFDSRALITTTRVGADNTFRVNVPAGEYLIIASNGTLNAPYATQVYGAATDYNNNLNAGSRVKLAVNETRIADMALTRGYRLSGTVRDDSGGKYVPGVRVRVDVIRNIDIGGPAVRVRTDGDGAYRVWLKPDSYKVDSRGNDAVEVSLSSSNKTLNFKSKRAIVKGVVKDGTGKPVGTVKVVMYEDPAGGSEYNLASQEISTSDGAFTLYGAAGSEYKVLFRVDDKKKHGSIVYTDAITINSGTTVRTNSNTSVINDIGTTILPTVGVKYGMGWIAGTVGTNDSTGIKGGQLVRVREAAGGRNKHFIATRTKGDGSYILPVPAGNYRVFILKTKYENTRVYEDRTTTLNAN